MNLENVRLIEKGWTQKDMCFRFYEISRIGKFTEADQWLPGLEEVKIGECWRLSCATPNLHVEALILNVMVS